MAKEYKDFVSVGSKNLQLKPITRYSTLFFYYQNLNNIAFVTGFFYLKAFFIKAKIRKRFEIENI